jgi:hypothetical protein
MRAVWRGSRSPGERASPRRAHRISGKRNIRVVSTNGKEIHRCAIGVSLASDEVDAR